MLLINGSNPSSASLRQVFSQDLPLSFHPVQVTIVFAGKIVKTAPAL